MSRVAVDGGPVSSPGATVNAAKKKKMTWDWFRASDNAVSVKYAPGLVRLLLGGALLALGVIVCAALIAVWPAVTTVTDDRPVSSVDAAAITASTAQAKADELRAAPAGGGTAGVRRMEARAHG